MHDQAVCGSLSAASFRLFLMSLCKLFCLFFFNILFQVIMTMTMTVCGSLLMRHSGWVFNAVLLFFLKIYSVSCDYDDGDDS